MSRLHRSAPVTILLALAGLASCLAPDAPDSAVEQASYLGGLGVALGSPIATGTTNGLSNDYQPSCVSTSNAPDAAYSWTAPASGTFVIGTAGSAFDTVLEIRDGNTGASLGCNDDSNSSLQSSVAVNLVANQSVVIVIDGYSSGSGTYQLGITGPGGSGGTGLHLWLSADTGVLTSGSGVTSWLDQSGNGRNASMATPARRPTLGNNGPGGLPAIHFNGSQSLYLDVFAQPTQFSVFVVGRNTRPDESFSMILGPGGNAPNNQLRWENGSQALFVGTGNNLPIITASVGNTRVYHALSASYDGSTMTTYRDGALMNSSSFTTTGPWTLASVGSWYSTYFMTGDLAEILIYDRALTSSERAAVNTYLRTKYFLP